MKIKATYETETYLSVGGHFAIKQVDSLGEEAVVFLSPEQMRLLIAEMQKRLEDTDWWVEATDDDEQG